jgi:phage terminase small subunit
VAPDLYVRGLLSAFDVLPLAAYCSCAGRLVEAEEALADLRRAGVDCIWVSPLIKVVERAAADVAKLGAEYGLTPTGRVRLAGAGTPPRPKSKFAGLISGH